jgi:hypothetical protein
VLAFQNLSKLGILTAADATNRLAVKSDAILFSHDDVTPGMGDLRVTLNKSAAGKDAGFIFQDGFSTRALFGLLADDDFTVKVTPDVSVFHIGFTVDRNTGQMKLPIAPKFSAYCSCSRVAAAVMSASMSARTAQPFMCWAATSPIASASRASPRLASMRRADRSIAFSPPMCGRSTSLRPARCR